MRQHHTVVHGEQLPNSECRDCGEQFYRKGGGKYCDECWEDDMSGQNNPNHTGAKEETTCNECGDAFEYYPSSKKGRFCTQCVQSGEAFEGPENRYQGGRVEYNDPTSRTGDEDSDVGVVSEKVFEAVCTKKNLNLSEPVTYMCPYDYIVEVDSELYKVQVKTGTVERERSPQIHNSEKKRKHEP